MQMNTKAIPIRDLKPEQIFDMMVTAAQINTLAHKRALPPMPQIMLDQAREAQQGQEKETKMQFAEINAIGVNTADTEIRNQRKYLQDQLYRAKYAHYEPLQRAFGLRDEDAPRSPTELVERIKAGMYTVKPGETDAEGVEKFYDSPMYYFRWRNPETKKDQEGYNAAKKLLEKAYTDAERVIMVGDAKEGLEAVKQYETATFH